MPKLTELFAFEVPEYTTPERSPSKIVPCPYCKSFHVVGRDAKFVRLQCADKGSDYAELLDGGEAPRRLLAAFRSGKALPADSDLWRLQPKAAWEGAQHITHGLANYLRAVDLL